ncbi:GGDEF domain-containing protein [Vibrio sp. HA2012]|nr:GGDEF domain-containing protein [Vibrio sp. HA2012]
MLDVLANKTLKDMADMSQIRQRRLCYAASAIPGALLTIYSVINLVLQVRYPFVVLNSISALLCFITLWRLKRSPRFCSTTLVNIALIITAVAHVVLPERHLFWVFPVIATVIIINRFKSALHYAIFFSLFLAGMLLAEWLNILPYTFTIDTLSAPLYTSYLAMCISCLTSNYYYRKTNQYLKDLYSAGIEELAYTDPLTGLSNRWSFEEWATRKLRQQRNSAALTALVFLDVDNFKYINDSLGHDAGDEVLQLFAKRLDNCVRHTDRSTQKHEYSVCRYAGDEFLLLLSDVPDLDTLKSILNRISESCSDKVEIGAYLQSVTFSIGVSLFGKDGDTLEKLIRCADQAMYVSKHNGKNQYSFY